MTVTSRFNAMLRYRIVHRTTYGFDRTMRGCELETRLSPRTLPAQQPGPWQIAVSPAPAWSRTTRDAFGNTVDELGVTAPFDTLAITSTGLVRCAAPHPALRPVIPWQVVAHRLRSSETALAEGRAFVTSSSLVPIGPDLMAYAASSFPAGRPLLDAAVDLVRRVRRDHVHDRGATTASTTASEALRLRRGVCQDLAHVTIGCLRARGLAARYVGGYLAGVADGQPAGGAHAWAAVWIPEWGWVDLDPTVGGFAGPGHITVAWGRDFNDVSPVRGTFVGEGAHGIDVRVEMRLEEDA